MIKNKYILFFIVMALLFVYVVVRFIQENNKIRNELPFFMHGERINKIEIVGMDKKIIDISFFKNAKKPSLLFIFSTPCSPCNKNIALWNKLAEYLKDKVSIYGIILDGFSQVNSFSESAKLNFKLYTPVRIDEFVKNMRLKLNIEQTILCDKNTVEFVFLGVLTLNDVTKILEIINNI